MPTPTLELLTKFNSRLARKGRMLGEIENKRDNERNSKMSTIGLLEEMRKAERAARPAQVSEAGQVDFTKGAGDQWAFNEITRRAVELNKALPHLSHVITGPMEVFAFSSHKKILLRCMREKGVKLTDTARLALEQLPSLFDEWKAAQSACLAAMAPELEASSENSLVETR
jgi:hypothetical protein